MESFINDLKISLQEGFIDRNYIKKGRYKPKLLVNNPYKNESVLESLLQELDRSKSFVFSVAFITESGLATLKSHLLDLKNRGIKGRILTSTFLNFNQPKVFKELLKITNVEVRLADVEGFHSKGYIFEHDTHYSLIVGSSNLTANALKKNHEWNVKLTSHENGDIVHHFKNQFEEIWEKSLDLTEEWINEYEKSYEPINSIFQEKIIELPQQYQLNPLEEALKIKPNKMQEAALKEIEAVRNAGKRKALVISATGTGKTYLSAFDVRRYSPKKMLFIVHREQILKKAKEDYKKILGGLEKDFGILSGGSKEKDAKYLFATIQSLSKDDILHSFSPQEFDYILIDEVHKAGARSYQKVIEYFETDFLLGMTATPERTDDFNIYKLFDYNIAYEIRLQEALEEDMLCPFHYFGVSDFEYNGETISDTTLLSKLVTEERVNHIIDKINYYGYSGEKVRGLMFCSRKEEAHELSAALNNKGFRTVALSGEHDQEERERRVNQLENGLLDYIITVDIFNEGIDIPSINQVVMLRQTQSSIIFIQQLGRGLRKHKSKDFVTVIDFIGNYKNNYLIPVALSGDNSQNKDNIRRHIKDTTYIKGVSTVNFEEVAKKRIFDSINSTNLTTLKILQDAFIELENRIGRMPYLYDFIKNKSIDPSAIVRKHDNYYRFLLKMEEKLSHLKIPHLSDYENSVLSMLSLEILNGKRKHELILLRLLLKNKRVSIFEYVEQLRNENCSTDDQVLESVTSIFSLSFFMKNAIKKYGSQPIVSQCEKGIYRFNNRINNSLKENAFFKELVCDVINCAEEKSQQYNKETPLTLYKKYSRKDVCRLLNWEKDESSTINGHRTKYNTCPIFVKYHKNEDVEASVNYKDEFINNRILRWFTTNNRTLKSPVVQDIINAKERGIDIHLFVRKDDAEGTDFYYLGKAIPDKKTAKQDSVLSDKGKRLPSVQMELILQTPVEDKLYSYLIQQ